MKKQNVGQWGEEKASEYLKQQGYKILHRNYHTKYGEIDIIAEKNDIISFIEVKTRKNSSYGFPAEFVNYSKQQKIIKTAEIYINTHFSEKKNYKFDIIEVFYYNSYIFHINHLEGAFEL